MTALVLLTGELARDPELRTSRNGRPYALATIRTKPEHGGYWSAFVFNESARESLMQLRAGDGVSAQGEAKFDIYKPNDGGEPRVSCSLNAGAVLPLKPVQRAEKREPMNEKSDDAGPRVLPKPAPRSPGNLKRYDCETDADLNDAVPF